MMALLSFPRCVRGHVLPTCVGNGRRTGGTDAIGSGHYTPLVGAFYKKSWKKEASITKEWGTLPGPQSPTGTMAPNADLSPSRQSQPARAIHFMLQCSCP